MSTTLILYYASFLVGYVVAFFINLTTYYKYHTTQRRVWLYSLTFIYGFLGAMVAGKVYTVIYQSMGFKNESILAMFGAVILVPLFEIVTVLIEKAIRGRVNASRAKTGSKRPLPPVSVRDTLDMLAPNVFLVMGFGKLGCHLNGCCYGIECAFGLHRTFFGQEHILFPVQLLEAGLIFAMLIALYFVKRRPFYRRGMAYPLTAGVYSALRFGVEYLRWYDEPMKKIVLGCMTVWQAAAILVFVSSAVSVFVLYKTGESSPLPKKNDAVKKQSQHRKK